MSLMDSRRYLLADGVERWRDRQLEAVAAALGRAAARPDRGPDRPRQSAGEARQSGQGRQGRDPRVRGAEGARHAARCWSPTRSGSASGSSPARPGSWSSGWAPTRCASATSWSAWRSGPGEGGEVTAADLEAMIADTSEAAVWSLSDALLEGDAAGALRDRRAADRPGRERHRADLRPRLAPAQRLRRRRPAGEEVPPKQVESSLKMHPYAAKQLVGRLRDADVANLRAGHGGPGRPRAAGAAAAPTTATSWR